MGKREDDFSNYKREDQLLLQYNVWLKGELLYISRKFRNDDIFIALKRNKLNLNKMKIFSQNGANIYI